MEKCCPWILPHTLNVGNVFVVCNGPYNQANALRYFWDSDYKHIYGVGDPFVSSSYREIDQQKARTLILSVVSQYYEWLERNAGQNPGSLFFPPLPLDDFIKPFQYFCWSQINAEAIVAQNCTPVCTVKKHAEGDRPIFFFDDISRVRRDIAFFFRSFDPSQFRAPLEFLRTRGDAPFWSLPPLAADNAVYFDPSYLVKYESKDGASLVIPSTLHSSTELVGKLKDKIDLVMDHDCPLYDPSSCHLSGDPALTSPEGFDILLSVLKENGIVLSYRMGEKVLCSRAYPWKLKFFKLGDAIYENSTGYALILSEWRGYPCLRKVKLK